MTRRQIEKDMRGRVEAVDWAAAGEAIAARGFATLPGFLDAGECAALIALDTDDARFRKRIEMARHNFGEGSYGYFAEPLPEPVAAMRAALYPPLAKIANAMMADLGQPHQYPRTLAAFSSRCRAHGQSKPTPLLLRYGAGGFNRLHQDIYGPLAFPLQGTVLLSRPGAHSDGADFTGGQFLLMETMPRQQSRGEAVALEQGELILFAGGDRPVPGKRGHRRARMRHGVATVTQGKRHTLGLIFHDAA
ncbi:MAG TPA: 2OG-Fe(II) oxygenase [Alphaproteobacteria bacterium]|nr:2OG-Fe(II) oxygenase [Alphaproteobacteria bacterium]